MGQAKRRGGLEDRILQAQERQAKYDAWCKLIDEDFEKYPCLAPVEDQHKEWKQREKWGAFSAILETFGTTPLR